MSDSLHEMSLGYKQLKEQGKAEEETDADQDEEQDELTTEEQLDLLGKSIIQLKEEIKEMKGTDKDG